MSTKQVLAILSVVVLMGILLSLDIKKAGKPSTENNKPSRTLPANLSKVTGTFNLDSLEGKDLFSLPADVSHSILSLEKEAKKKMDASSYLKVAISWSKASKSFWSAHYYYKAATASPQLENWLKAGNALNESLSNVQDSTLQRLIFTEASTSFTEAIKLDSNNLEATTGLGVCYVAGGENPMKGIGLLLQVVQKDPKNIKANFSLGLFSMKSGQYQKAVNRFKTVVEQEPSGEAYFYMAQAYQNLQMKKEAIDAYLQSKKYLDDPQTLTSIDHFIKELTH